MESKDKDVSEATAKKQLPALILGVLAGVLAGASGFGLGFLIDGVTSGYVMGGVCGGMGFLFTAMGVAIDRENARDRVAWETASQGVFDRVEYVPRGRYHHLATVVHYDDGRACVLTDAAHNIGFPRGTKIVVERNKLYDYRIKVQK